MQPDLAVELGTKETATLEFKSNARDRDKIGKTICALANDLPNKGGGDLLIGVNDDGTPTGTVDDSDSELLKLTEFRDGGEILDRPSLVVDRALYSGERVVRIQIKAAVAPPIRFRGIAYVRPGPTTRKANPDDERLLAERRRANDLPFEMRPKYFTTRADLDMNLFTGTYLPAAIAPEVIGAAAIADDHEIGGNVIAVETQLDPVLRGNLRTGIAPEGILREVPRPEYPWSAIREAVMNAIMHRDYEVSNAPIRIDWFDDRIEISNPGGPYGRVRKDNFDHVNDYRNPSLAAAMKTLGYVNRFGRGITRIKEAMEQNGNPPPEFAVDDAYWSVALRGMS